MSNEMGLVPVAWRHRGPRGGWITTETKKPWSEQPLYDAAAIERLVAERDEAREALKPFAKYGELHAGQRPEFVEIGLWTYNSKGEPDGIELKSRDFFRARQALGEP